MNDTPTPEEVADTLEAAADYIDVNGWYQGGSYDYDVESDTPPACLVGAVGKVTRDTAAIRHMERYLGVTAIGPWNDAPERVQADVTDALRHSAKALRNGEAL